MASLGAVIIKCLICDEELPPIRVTASHYIQGPGRQVRIGLQPELDDAWYEQAHVEHAECMADE